MGEATVDATPNLQKPDPNRDAQAETKLLTSSAEEEDAAASSHAELMETKRELCGGVLLIPCHAVSSIILPNLRACHFPKLRGAVEDARRTPGGRPVARAPPRAPSRRRSCPGPGCTGGRRRAGCTSGTPCAPSRGTPPRGSGRC